MTISKAVFIILIQRNNITGRQHGLEWTVKERHIMQALGKMQNGLEMGMHKSRGDQQQTGRS